MKSLFDEKEYYYSPKANELERRTVEFAEQEFGELMAEGYSPREISHILQGAIQLTELISIMDARRKHDKEHGKDLRL